MSGLYSSLGVVSGALMTHQRALQVHGHNIVNAVTPGYHRQEAQLEAIGPQNYGVRFAGVKRVVDQQLLRRIERQVGEHSSAEARSGYLRGLDTIIGDLSENGIAGSLDKFFASWRELTASPDEAGARLAVVKSSEDLASTVTQAALELQETRRDANEEIILRVDRVNELLDEVRLFNRQIVEIESSGQAAMDMRDQRDIVIQELSDLVGAESYEDDSGYMTVQIAGGLVVAQQDTARYLKTKFDNDNTSATFGMHNLSLEGASQVPLDARLREGKIGGLLQIRDEDIPGFTEKLDDFVDTFVQRVNAVHSDNYGLDDTNGRNLFVDTMTGAVNMSVVSDLDPDHVAASDALNGGSGNGNGAKEMLALEGDDTMGDDGNGNPNKTFAQGLNGFYVDLGHNTRVAEDHMNRSNDRLEYLNVLSEENSGVSIEEEMVNLNMMQRSYQASSRVLSVIDKMLDSLLAMA